VQLPDFGAGLAHVLPVPPQSASFLQVAVEQVPVVTPPQLAPLTPVQSDAVQQLIAANAQLPVFGAGLVHVPAPHSALVLQVAAEQVPSFSPLQVALALIPVQSAFAQQLVAGNLQLPLTGAGFVHVLPVPQSPVTRHVAAEHAPTTAPPHVALALRLVQSEFAKQLVAVGTQAPAAAPEHVPTPQSVLNLHVAAEHVPVAAPLHDDDQRLEQSVFAKHGTLHVPMAPPLQPREPQSPLE